MTDHNDAVSASATVVAPGTLVGMATMTVSVRSLPIRPTAKPPGYLMARIARGVFFLAPKRLRVFEEIVAYSRSYAPAVLGKIIKVWRGG